MKKILGSIRKPRNEDAVVRSNGSHYSSNVPTGDGPEAVIYREVTAFCESGAPGSHSSGDEYLHLPAIVDAAESSPAAATQAAVRIRMYLSKDNYDRGYAQYNAIMLSRILTDNPGRAFTKNFDKDFVSTVKKLLREGPDSSVLQILRETLDYFEVKSKENDSLAPLMDMWRREKGMGARIVYPQSRRMPLQQQQQQQQQRGGPPMQHRHRGLPPPDELAGRIEEARTTARLLVQTIQSTPSNEMLGNELVREFAERCRAAQKNLQGYMNAENPHPDDDTMLTLIETSEQLNVAMSKHQRAVLQARKSAGAATPSPQPQDPSRTGNMTGGENVYTSSPPLQQPKPQQPPLTQQQPQQQPGYQQQDYKSLSPPVPDGPGRTSPRNESFAPPAGPPPGRPMSSVYSKEQIQPSTYQAPTVTSNYNAPTITSNSTAPSQTETKVSSPPATYKTPKATADYEVGENPFSDDADYEAPQQQNYSLFGRGSKEPPRQPAETNAYGQPENENPYSQQTLSTQHRPGPYSQAFVPTPSYAHRQDSAAEHITMHGASPPQGPQR